MSDPLERLSSALADRYRLERELGQGGMATVYLAHDLKHDRDVALKVLRPELAAVLGAERFLQEIRTTANLQHLHILPLLDSGQSHGFLWYVLPYVRGESLRGRLEREHQLPLPDALAITKQIAGALDYAHREGVIHRDVKPENILLQEGEAVLTDFGIALAVKEAASNRLTETGLSLGTPQYMSPEQATGERRLDARSDVYSLGAVLYEMLTGEPPHTGATAQVVIAKLMTERPTPVRVLRDRVPERIDAAVARALAKVPADRFRSADEFARALDPPGAGPAATLRSSRRRQVIAFAVGGAVVVLGTVGLWAALRGHGRGNRALYLDRTQITFTGNATHPAISPEGSQIAYVVSDCSNGQCRYGVEVRDLAGGGARRLVDDAQAIVDIQWSSDRRYLLVRGLLRSRLGTYLVPILGGAPRYLWPGFASFAPRGDSLLLSPFRDKWIRVATLDGEPRDSFEVTQGASSGFGKAVALRGGRWVAVTFGTDTGLQTSIVDRHGVLHDRLSTGLNFYGGVSMSDEALWLDFSSDISHGPLVRVPLDLAHGKFDAARDTALDHKGAGFDVTPDGRMIAYVDGAYQYGVWTLGLDEALKGHFAPQNRLLSSTALALATLSPEASRVLVSRTRGNQVTLSVLPRGGGPEVNLRAGTAVKTFATWTPDGLVAYALTEASGLRFVAADPESGATVRSLLVHDSSTGPADEFAALADSGWAWIAGVRGVVRVQYPGDDTYRDFAVPDSGLVVGLQAAPDGRRLGIEAITPGSLVVCQVALPEGRVTRLASFQPPSNGDASWLADGGLLVFAEQSRAVASLYRVHQSGQVDTLGTVPRSLVFLHSGLDGRHLVVTSYDFQTDLWLARRSGGH